MAKLTDNSMLTPAQHAYIEQLFIDTGMSVLAVRNEFLSEKVGRPVKFIDELTKVEASLVIDDLRARREQIREKERKEWKSKPSE